MLLHWHLGRQGSRAGEALAAAEVLRNEVVFGDCLRRRCFCWGSHALRIVEGFSSGTACAS